MNGFALQLVIRMLIGMAGALKGKLQRHIPVLGLCFMALLASPAALGAIVISEFMASNDSTIADEDGDYSDWIELHNDGVAPVNLQGWYLTDDFGDLTKWQLPETLISADEFLIIYASSKDRAVNGAELHSNFKLSAGGEYLGLVMPDGVTISSQFAPEYPPQFTDLSYGGSVYFSVPTPGAANGIGVNGLIEPVSFSVGHGFFSAPQTLELSSTTANSQIRYTLDGSVPVSSFGCQPPSDGKRWDYEYFEGSWANLPDFDALTPIASGTVDDISTAPRLHDTNFGFRFNGCIHAERAGLYTFSTTSNDGSQLFVDDALVVDNGGLHASQTVSNTLYLEAGLHTVQVVMFQAGGDEALSANWIAPSRSNAFVFTSDLGQLYAADPSSGNSVVFEFTLPANGEYRFDARVQGPNHNANSFWVQLDDGPLWQFHTSVNSSGFSQEFIRDSVAGIISVLLTSGNHVLRFFPREDGTRLDSVVVTGVNCEGPCELQTLEAEDAKVGGIFSLAGTVAEPLQGAHWRTYTGPLSIDTTTTLRAVAVRDGYLPANPVTQSYLFLDDIVLQAPSGDAPDGWPDGTINGQILDYGMDPEIVDPDPEAVKVALASLPAVSLVTDTDNLFHPQTGIYVNAQNKGRHWERPASLEIIDNSGAEPGFTIDAGIRIRGGFSRTGNNPKHAFRVFFRSEYGGDLQYPLFGTEGADWFEKFDLRTSQNYSWAFEGDSRNTFLREVWSRDTQRDLNHPYTRSRYYHLFINGLYWGIYMSQERVSKEFAATYLGGAEADYDVVKHNRSDGYRFEATDGNNNSWNTLWTYVSDQTIDTSEYTAVEQIVNLQNLVEYIMVNAFEGDTDGSPSAFISSFKRSNNWYGVFDRASGGAKFTFYQHDGEHSLGIRRNPSVEENLLGPYAPFNGDSNSFFTNDYFGPYWLHAALTSNNDYRQLFIDKSAMHFGPGGVLSTDKALTRWYSRKAQVGPAILAESARWGDAKRSTPLTVADWQAEVDFVEHTFFPTRSGIVFDQLVAQGLASLLPAPEFSVPSGSLLEPGSVVSITNGSGDAVWYTLNGSDPRAPGGGVSPSAILLAPGETIPLTENTSLRIRFLQGLDWGPISDAIFYVNAVPVIDPIADQISTVGQVVSLPLSALDDDVLAWSAVDLPAGLAIDSVTGEISGELLSTGAHDVIVTVDDGDVTVDTRFSWSVFPPARLILNEYNGVSDTKYLGGGDGASAEPFDSRLGRIIGNGGDWFELAVVEDHLDIRGWQLLTVDDGLPNAVLTFTQDPLWADLRSGTIITVAGNSIVGADNATYAEDISYSPSANDWWINIVANDMGAGQYISAADFTTSNNGWQIEIRDNGGQTVFGPAGEGIWTFSGVNSEEVGKLEEDPKMTISPGSNYDDGTSSSFGEPNRYAGDTEIQDFGSLRSVVPSEPIISVADAVVGEGGCGARVIISMSHAATEDTSFIIATSDESAIGGADYTSKGGRRIIPAGDVEKTVRIPITDDIEAETDETFLFEISEATNAVIEDGMATVTIIDNDSGAPLPLLNVSDSSPVEGTKAQFLIRLSEPSSEVVTFRIDTVDESATGGIDYTSKGGTRKIPAGDVEKTIWVPTADDTDVEGNESFRLEISCIGNAAPGDTSATASIVDNDGIALPDLTISDATVVEGAKARFLLMLSEPAPLPIRLTILTVDETAKGGSDYVAKSGNRTIPAGSTEAFLWVPTVDDVDNEGDETFRLEISNVSNAVPINSSGTATIIDNE